MQSTHRNPAANPPPTTLPRHPSKPAQKTPLCVTLSVTTPNPNAINHLHPFRDANSTLTFCAAARRLCILDN